jgi:hypothetical protein
MNRRKRSKQLRITILGKTRCVLLHFDSSKLCVCPQYKFLYAFKFVKLFLKHPVFYDFLHPLETCNASGLEVAWMQLQVSTVQHITKQLERKLPCRVLKAWKNIKSYSTGYFIHYSSNFFSKLWVVQNY